MASAAVALVALFVGPASAAQTRVYTGPAFGPDGAGGQKTFQNVQSIAVDQTTGDVFVYDPEAPDGGRVYKFDEDGNAVPFKASGTNFIKGVGGSSPGENQIAVAPEGSPGGTAGDLYVAHSGAKVGVYSPEGKALGAFGEEGELCGVAVDPSGHVFVGSYPSTILEYVPSANPPKETDVNPVKGDAKMDETGLCNVAADGAGAIYASAYLGERTVQLQGLADPEPSEINPPGITLAADPTTDQLYLDQGDRVEVFESSTAALYDFGAKELTSSYGVGIGPDSARVYVGDGGSGTVKVFGPAVTLAQVTTEAASAIAETEATLNGSVDPEGAALEECYFEYGPDDGGAAFAGKSECEPDASEIPVGSASRVKAALDGLQPNANYKFRLTATNSGGTVRGETLFFGTSGAPRVTEVQARADDDSATLEATIDPHGGDTSYRIEWGPTAAYGNIAATGVVAEAGGPARVTGQLAGLAPGSAYHYRIVASNPEGGPAPSPDHLVETLNSCGFTDGRCLELVSRADKGPFASPGKKVTFKSQIQFQAAGGGSALAYTVASGYPETTAGVFAAVYLGRRGTAGWTSEQLNVPTVEPPIGAQDFAENSEVSVLSPSLGCSAIASNAPLTAGAPVTTVEAGGSNLYLRDNATGAYQLVTSLAPVNPAEVEPYRILGTAPDCGRVVFRTRYRYPGIPAAGAAFQLYEWDGGVLRDIALIPGPGGSGEPVPAGSLPGALPEPSGAIGNTEVPPDYWRAVAADGSRATFSAVSEFGADSGQVALFSSDRNDPAVAAGTVAATDISQSETAVPNDGDSRYWTASADGRRVFFTARYGLAGNGSSSGPISCSNVPGSRLGEDSGEGCDLYEYDADAPDGAHLTDLSADPTDAGGAGVVAVLDASEDGSYVYFAARGRLGGGGRTEGQNREAATYNVYLAHAGAIRYVGALGDAEVQLPSSRAKVGTGENSRWTSRSSADGTRFVFESSSGTPGGVPTVYLFSAADATTECISCRRDGAAPFAEPVLIPLIGALDTNSSNQIVQPTTLTDNGRLYFYSFDPLAPGGVEGQRNLFQWENGQISLIASEPAGVPRTQGLVLESFFGGASLDGGDVFFATPQDLVGADRDGRWDVYDARVGGGFPEPAPPAAPCAATTEGDCNPGSPNSPASTTPATSTFGGPANPPTKKKKHHKKGHRGRKHHRGHGRRGKARHHKAGGAHRPRTGRSSGR